MLRTPVRLTSGVSRHMRAIAFLALSLATFQACHAGDRAPPFDFAGQYTRSHQVRDWIGQCPSGQPSQCAQVTVTDRVLVTRSGPSRFHIEVSLAFDDLHVCDFSGVGKWNGRALVARSNDTEDSCTVSVIFAKGQLVRLTASPNTNCAIHCGANGYLYADRMLRQPSEGDKK